MRLLGDGHDDRRLPVHRSIAPLDRRSGLDNPSDIPDADGHHRALTHTRDDQGVLDVLNGAYAAEVADDEFFILPDDKAAAGVFVALFNGPFEIRKGQVVEAELFRVRADLELLDITPHDRDLRNAGDRQQSRTNGPVGQGSKVHG